MPLFGRRLPWESQQTVTIALRAARYRITLRLPTAAELDEYFFPHAIGTDDGKIERLQVLGFYNRPLDYDFTVRGGAGYTKADCLAVATFYYRRFFGLGPAADITLTLNQKILAFWLDDGTTFGQLPGPAAFARLRMPGGHGVYWPKGCAEAERDLFGSGGQSRYAVEQRFHTANPLLGKIPIVVAVERRDATHPVWAPAPAGVEVALSLIKPAKDLPARHFVTPPPPRRGTLAKRDDDGRVVTPAATSDDGPWRYLRDRVVNYVPGRNGDPQKRNVHWHLGGKRDLDAVGDSVCVPAPPRACIFPLGVGAFGARHTAARDGAPGSKHTVLADTDDRGLAVIMFAPSRIGGDRYKLQAQIGPTTRAADGEKCNNVRKTGTMVVWRNIRVLHHIRVKPPTGTGDLDPTVAADLHTTTWTCLHNAHLSGRICADCLAREAVSPGELEWIDFTTLPKTELAKAYCELQVDPSIQGGTYEKMSDARMTAALDRAIAVVQANAAVNSFDNADEPEPLCFAVADGRLTDFGTRKVASKFRPGAVRIMVAAPGEGAWRLLALHNSVAGTAGAPPSIVPATSTYDRTTRRLVLTFASAVDPAWNMQIENQRADETIEKIKLEPANLAGDNLSLTQTMAMGTDLRAAFKVLIAGVSVGRDQATNYSKLSTELQPVPAYAGPQQGVKGTVTLAKKAVVAIRCETAVPNGVEIKVYGDGDNSGVGGYANGFVLLTGTGVVDAGFRDVKVDGLLKKQGTVIKAGDEVIATSGADGKFVGRPGASVTLHRSCSVTLGTPAKLDLTFPTALLGTEDLRLRGGGAGPDDVFLEEFRVPVEATKTKVTVDLPKDVKRYETRLLLGGEAAADDAIRLVAVDAAGALAVRSAVVDAVAGTIALDFTAAPPAGTRIGAHFICPDGFCDLPHLFFHPAADKKTPFLFNLHTPWAYNALKGAAFGPLPATSVWSGERVSTGAGGTELTLTAPHMVRTSAMRVDMDGTIWARPGSGLSGAPALSRSGPGLGAEFDLSVSEGRSFRVKRKAALPRDKELTLHYQSPVTRALERTAWGEWRDGDGALGVPTVVVKWTAKMLTAVLTEFFRQIENNRTFIPGLVFVQAPLYDTLSCTYAGGAQVGLAQGAGSFLTGSKMFKKPNGYVHSTSNESEDTVQSGNVLVIGLHEICHSLFFQHAPSAGGNYPQDHDHDDACLMSYSDSMSDFCGQCLASLRGLNYTDARLVTADDRNNAIPYPGVDHLKTQPVAG